MSQSGAKRVQVIDGFPDPGMQCRNPVLTRSSPGHNNVACHDLHELCCCAGCFSLSCFPRDARAHAWTLKASTGWSQHAWQAHASGVSSFRAPPSWDLGISMCPYIIVEGNAWTQTVSAAHLTISRQFIPGAYSFQMKPSMQMRNLCAPLTFISHKLRIRILPPSGHGGHASSQSAQCRHEVPSGYPMSADCASFPKVELLKSQKALEPCPCPCFLHILLLSMQRGAFVETLPGRSCGR